MTGSTRGKVVHLAKRSAKEAEASPGSVVDEGGSPPSSPAWPTMAIGELMAAASAANFAGTAAVLASINAEPPTPNTNRIIDITDYTTVKES